MAAASTTPSQVRPRREREEELLVWPDLVFVEFICAVLFTFTFTVISTVVNAPLINRANPNVTPNPSKAPWYFLNLQELLLHMNPALAGVVVPTVLLIVLAAVPYIDRSKEGQGVWFGTPNAVRITVFSSIFSFFGTVFLILFDSSKHVQLYEMRWFISLKKLGINFSETIKPSLTWPVGEHRPDWLPHVGLITALWDLALSRSVRSIQTEWTWKTDLGGLVPLLQKGPHHDGYLNWPQDFTQIPLPFNMTSWPWHAGHHNTPPPLWFQHLPGWFTGLLPYDLNLNFPAFLVEILIPTLVMVGLPALLLYILWRIDWLHTRRDVMISLFTGFIVAYWVMTLMGAMFRGSSQTLVFPWDVPRID